MNEPNLNQVEQKQQDNEYYMNTRKRIRKLHYRYQEKMRQQRSDSQLKNNYAQNSDTLSPLLQKIKPKSVLIDLNNVLVHLKINDDKSGSLYLRPFTITFLKQMNEKYNMCLLIESNSLQVDFILERFQLNLTLKKQEKNYVNIDQQFESEKEDLIKITTQMGQPLLNNVILIEPFYGNETDEHLKLIMEKLLQNQMSEKKIPLLSMDQEN